MTTGLPDKGFTLIEVVTAISIFAVLSFGVYKVSNGVISAQERILEHSSSIRRISNAVRIIESDFRQIVERSIYDENGKEIPAYATDVDGYKNKKISVEFTRLGVRNPLLIKKSEVVRVAYGYEEDIDKDEIEKYGLSKEEGDFIENNNTGYLFRYYWPVLDRGTNNEPIKQFLLSGVSSFSIQYLDEDKIWISDWPPLSGNGLTSNEYPYSVKVIIDMKNGDTINRVFQLQCFQTSHEKYKY